MSSEESVSLDHISSVYFALFFLPSTLTHLPTEQRNVAFGYIRTVTRLLGLQESLRSAERTMNCIMKCAPVVAVLFSCSVVSDSLRPHGLQHARLPCSSLSPALAQTHVHQVSDAIKPSDALLPPSCLAFNLSHHQGLFQ